MCAQAENRCQGPLRHGYRRNALSTELFRGHPVPRIRTAVCKEVAALPVEFGGHAPWLGIRGVQQKGISVSVSVIPKSRCAEESGTGCQFPLPPHRRER